MSNVGQSFYVDYPEMTWRKNTVKGCILFLQEFDNDLHDEK